MAKQKPASKTQKTSIKPKSDKKRRPKEQIDRVKKWGEMFAGIAGAIIALISIRWKVSSQTVRGLRYVVTIRYHGLICQCEASAGGRMDCRCVFGVHRLLQREWWKDRLRKRIQIKRQKIRCRTQVPVRKDSAQR